MMGYPVPECASELPLFAMMVGATANEVKDLLLLVNGDSALDWCMFDVSPDDIAEMYGAWERWFVLGTLISNPSLLSS